MSFFKVFKKAFEWTDECKKAFQDLKVYLTTSPLLSLSIPSEKLYLYLAISPTCSKYSINQGRRESVETCVLYKLSSKGAKGRYLIIEKLAFALITASKKLRHYFQAHFINVMTDHLLKKVMNKLEAAGRLIQWAIELSEFDIRYQPKNAIKAQALANFIAEFTPSHGDLDDGNEAKAWVIHEMGSPHYMQEK